MKRQRRETKEEQGEEKERHRIERANRAERRESQINVRTKSCESCPSSARQNAFADTNTNTDIISTLPDPILAHILSNLWIVEAVATSILSSRWRTLWTLIPKLYLQEPDLERPDLNLSFVDIVSRIWTLRNAISNPVPLHTFSICWSTPCRPFYVDTWVRAAILRGLEVLCLHNYCNDTESLVELPRSLFFSTTLVTLKLKGNIYLNPPSDSWFPSLRKLQLSLFKYANSDSLSTILTACPVLQDLELDVHLHAFQVNFNITIQVPTLKGLQLCCTNYFESSSSFKVYINTPSLECFTFEGHLGKYVVLENLPNLVELVLAVQMVDGVSIEDYAKRVRDLIRPFAHIKSLGLFTETTKVIKAMLRFS